MSEPQLEPSKITKPIQLLAAWLAGLILVNGSFLAAAASLNSPEWARAALVIASIVNVPLFLVCLFLLQTKFRPEMQEDAYYAKYLEFNTGKLISTAPAQTAVEHLRSEIAESQHRYTELFLRIDDTLKAITSSIATRLDATGADVQPERVLTRAASEVDTSAKALAKATEQAIEAQARVHINDLLPDYLPIRRELRDRRISIDATFGSTSTNPEVPKRKIIGFGRFVPLQQLRRVVEACHGFGFNEIHFSSQEYNDRRIYIGSYIYRAPDEPQPVPFTEHLLNVLNAPESELDDVIQEVELARG